jgi:hypothetical protein
MCSGYPQPGAQQMWANMEYVKKRRAPKDRSLCRGLSALQQNAPATQIGQL